MGLFAGKLQLKTALHVHTTNSDGNNPLNSVIEEHYARDYDILAITDHGFVTYDWINAPNGLTAARFAEISTGSDRGNRPMLEIPNSAEQSTGLWHVNTFFMNYLYPPTSDAALEQLLTQGAALNGLVQLNHPTMEIGAANANNPVFIARYADIIMRHPVMFCQEIINMHQGPANPDVFAESRYFWDNLNGVLMPQGRVFWGTGTDDTHNNARTGYTWTVVVAAANTLAAFREAMTTGSFYSFSRIARLEGVSNPDRDNPNIPVIDDIEVDHLHIHITAHNYNRIDWITEGTRRIAQGPVLNFARLPPNIGFFARANVIGSGGIAFTQPFPIHRVAPKEFDLYSNISLKAEPFLPDHLIPMRYLSAPEPEIPPAPPPPDPSEFPDNPRDNQRWQNPLTLDWFRYHADTGEWVFFGTGSGLGILPPTTVPPIAIAMDMVKIAVNQVGDPPIPPGGWVYLPMFRLPNRRGICITFDIHAARHTYSNTADQTLSGTAHFRFTDDNRVEAQDTFMSTKHQSWHRRIGYRVLPNTTGDPFDWPLEVFLACRNGYTGCTVLIRDAHRLTRERVGAPELSQNAIEEIQITSSGYEPTPPLPNPYHSDPDDLDSPLIDPTAGIQILRETGVSYIDYIDEVTLEPGFAWYAHGNRIEYNGIEVRIWLTIEVDTTVNLAAHTRVMFVLPPALCPNNNLYAPCTVNWWANLSKESGESSAAYIGIAMSGNVSLVGVLPTADYGGYILFQAVYAVLAPGTVGVPYMATRPPLLASQLPLPAPKITSALTISRPIGQAFSYTIIATNSPTHFAATGLLPWMTRVGAVISGTPTATVVNHPIQISATNAAGTDTKTLEVTITA